MVNRDILYGRNRIHEDYHSRTLPEGLSVEAVPTYREYHHRHLRLLHHHFRPGYNSSLLAGILHVDQLDRRDRGSLHQLQRLCVGSCYCEHHPGPVCDPPAHSTALAACSGNKKESPFGPHVLRWILVSIVLELVPAFIRS